MNIVVLDGHTLNPGDLSWDAIAKLGTLTVHPRTTAAELPARAAHADILLTNKVPLNAATINSLPNLKLISVLATGYNIIDTAAARARNIPVSNVPEYSTSSVAQLVFALLLEMCHHVGHHSDAIRAGEWPKREWCFWDTPLVELEGKTLGIVGYGRIGQRVGTIAQALGMKVLGHSRRQLGPTSPNFAWATIDQIFAKSDAISLHIPLTPENKGFVNARLLSQMKKDAYLINTARGPLLNDADLAAALHAGTLAGAALDVATVEPINPDNPLLTAPNCIITPHYAWATLAARKRLMQTTTQNLQAFLSGTPQHVVN